MTSPTIPGFAQQDLDRRSVRDVVEYSPEQVNDAWCRKILRKILQSLELQYAMQMPHRTITPDTIVFHANGEPLLISDDIDPVAMPDSHQADDLTALARVIHYAITQELAPAGPLEGRVDGYSAALVATVDACMDPDPARRPHSVDAVRGLLGIAVPGPLAGATSPGIDLDLDLDPDPDPDAMIAAEASGAGVAAAHTAVTADPAIPAPVERIVPDPVAGKGSAGSGAPADAAIEARQAGTRSRRGRTVVAAGGAIALALSLFAGWRDAGPYRRNVPTLPQTGAGAPAGPAAPGAAASTGTVGMAARTDQAGTPEPGDPAGAAATATAHEPPGGTAREAAGSVTANPASDRAGSLAAGASSGGATRSGSGADRPDAATRVAPDPASAAAGMASTAPPTMGAGAAAPANGKAAAAARAAMAPSMTVAPSKTVAPSTAVAPSTTVAPSAFPGDASYRLDIQPWGRVYVDGVERGVSPPLRRLALTPGRHTIRIAHPDYGDSILEFDSAKTTSNGKIIVDFNHEAR